MSESLNQSISFLIATHLGTHTIALTITFQLHLDPVNDFIPVRNENGNVQRDDEPL